MFNLSTRVPKKSHPNAVLKQQTARPKQVAARSKPNVSNPVVKAPIPPVQPVHNPIPFKAKPYQRPKFARSLTNADNNTDRSTTTSRIGSSSSESNTLASILNSVYNKTLEDSEPELILPNKRDERKITAAKYNSIKYNARLSRLNKDGTDNSDEDMSCSKALSSILNALSRNTVENEPIEIIQTVERLFAKPKTPLRPEFTRAATNPNFKTGTKSVAPSLRANRRFTNAGMAPVKATKPQQLTAAAAAKITAAESTTAVTPFELLSESLHVNNDKNNSSNLSSILSDLLPTSMYEEADLREEEEAEEPNEESDVFSLTRSSRATTALAIPTCVSSFSDRRGSSDKSFEETKAALKMEDPNLKAKPKTDDLQEYIIDTKADTVKDISKTYNLKKPITLNRRPALHKPVQKPDVSKVANTTAATTRAITPTLRPVTPHKSVPLETNVSPKVPNESSPTQNVNENTFKSVGSKGTNEKKAVTNNAKLGKSNNKGAEASIETVDPKKLESEAPIVTSEMSMQPRTSRAVISFFISEF